MKSKFDIYQDITDRIIAKLQQGEIPWNKPWVCSGARVDAGTSKQVAFNRVTKRAYSLLNQLTLRRVGEYASFKQWTELGGHIRKGAKGEVVVFYKWQTYKVPTDKKDEDDEDEKKWKLKEIPILKYYVVFHIEDVEGVEPLAEDEFKGDVQRFDDDADAEGVMTDYLTREHIPLTYKGNRAFYRPSTDEIYLPEKFKFGRNGAEFYSTAFHEMVHSTGAEKRLHREFGMFGDGVYSKEELVAEIGASSILYVLGIETDSTFQNSTAYIQSWLKALSNDNKMVVSAAARADKAVRLILNYKEEDTDAA